MSGMKMRPHGEGVGNTEMDYMLVHTMTPIRCPFPKPGSQPFLRAVCTGSKFEACPPAPLAPASQQEKNNFVSKIDSDSSWNILSGKYWTHTQQSVDAASRKPKVQSLSGYCGIIGFVSSFLLDLSVS